MLAAISRDVHSAFRGLRRRPLFAAAVVGTLALGIGANTAIFTVVHAVLLRALPFDDAGRLVAVHSKEPGSDREPFSIPDFEDLRAGVRTVDALVGYGGWTASLTGVDEPVTIPAQWATRGYFETLGIRAALGRTPRPEEERPGGPHVALLGDGLWRSRFGADPAIVGRALALNGEPFTVIGVLPRDFVFLSPAAQIVAPIILETDSRHANRGAGFLRVVARLEDGVSIPQARADFDTVVAGLREKYPDTDATKEGVRLQPLAELVSGNYRRMLYFLQAAVGVVLLIACTNLASLLLARIVARRPELALRSALGAGRGDLLRQLLTETGLLALVGGVIGLGVAAAGVRLLLAFGPAQLPRAATIGLDGPVLLFNLVLSLAVGLGMGVVPALHGTRFGPSNDLRGLGRGNTDGRGTSRARSVLVAAEVGLSLVLLVGAGLLLRTLHRLAATSAGFSTDHLLAVQLSLPKKRYGTPETVSRYADQVTARLAAVPGVTDAAPASINPLTQWRASITFTIDGRADQDPRKAPLANYRAVGPGYFRTLRMPLLGGRAIEARDTAASVPVAVVSDTLARRHFPAASPIGARLRIDDQQPPRVVEVIGVVGDVKHTGLDAEPTADVYVPYAQTTPEVAIYLTNIFCVAVRTNGDPMRLLPALRREIRALDPDVAVASARTMDEAYAASLADRRFNTALLEIFGAAALALALAGIYAVTAFSVAERTREIGVRLSLGSSRGRILGLVARRALSPIAAGLAAGAVVSLALGRLIAGLLVGVAPHDPATLVAAIALLAASAAGASMVPALRATKIDPVRALRAN